MSQPEKIAQQPPDGSKTSVSNADWIKNLDIMGGKFKLQYTKTSKAFKTRLGGIVTLVVAFLSFAASAFVCSQYFDTSSPVVTTSRELSRSAQSLNLFGKDVITPLTVSSNRIYEPLKTNNYVTVRGLIMTKIFDPATNSTKFNLSKQFNYIPCSWIKEDPSIVDLAQKLAEGLDLDTYLCPHYKEVDNNATISNDPEKYSSSYLVIKLYPCSLPVMSDCYPPRKVFGAEVIYGLISPLVSPSNYEDPVSLKWTGVGQYIDLMRTKSYRYVFEQNKIMDDRQIFGGAKIKDEYGVFNPLSFDSWARDMTQLYCSTAMIDAGECQEYVELVYEMDNEVVITKRRYKKIPALLGEFGGILKLLTTAFVIISFYYSFAINSFLFDKVFTIKKSKAKKLMKKAELELCADAQRSREKAQKQSEEKFIEVLKGGQSRLKDKKMLVKEALKEAIDSKTEITGLVKKMNFGDVLETACLKKHHQTLLPLVLLTSSQPSDELTKSSSYQPEKLEEIEQEQENLEKAKGAAENLTPLKNKSRNGDKLFGDLHTYNALKRLRPKNSLDKMLSQEILCYLSLVYGHD